MCVVDGNAGCAWPWLIRGCGGGGQNGNGKPEGAEKEIWQNLEEFVRD